MFSPYSSSKFNHALPAAYNASTGARVVVTITRITVSNSASRLPSPVGFPVLFWVHNPDSDVRIGGGTRSHQGGATDILIPKGSIIPWLVERLDGEDNVIQVRSNNATTGTLEIALVSLNQMGNFLITVV